VHVWTVDAADDIELCRDLGVEAIITNRPGRVLRALGREAGPPPA
jgi:glycerophosphoryl diester phosphodiesterase